jgi:hypothetical protein
MRNAFRQYFRPTEAEIQELWTTCLFSFDASVLLNIYGYSNDTRDDLVHVIEGNSDRVRLPHQCGLEYSRNRSKVIVKQVNNYSKAEKELDNFKDVYIAPKRDHPFLSKKSLAGYKAIQRELAESRKKLEALIGSDPYAEKILTVFKDRVSQAPSGEDLEKMYAEAEVRYKSQVPPGYSDLKEKGIPGGYGDYVGWCQLMKIAESEKRGIIFVIDDFKEDWWQIQQERTIGPRPELLEEFTRKTQQRLYLYTSENFLRAAKRFMALEISEGVIQEVTLRLESQRQKQRGFANKPSVAESPTANADKPVTSSEDKPANQMKPAAPMFGSSEADEPSTKGE